MNVKVWMSRLKRLVLKLLELMVAGFMPAHADKDDWRRYYDGYFG